MKLIFLPLIHCGRPCSYKAHIPFQNIPELRKFVKGCFPDKVADSFRLSVFSPLFTADNAGIIVHFKHQTIHLVVFHQLGFSFLRIHIHAPEFVYLKFLSVLPDTDLGKKDRPRRFQIDHRADNNDQKQRDYTAYKASCQIHQPLIKHLLWGSHVNA